MSENAPRALTEDEQKIVEDLDENFDGFISALMEMTGDFAERVGLPDPHLIVQYPERYLADVTEVLRNEELEDSDLEWILPRVAFLTAEILCERLGGGWFVNIVPDTEYFARYVIGNFRPGTKPGAMVDPLGAAADFLALPPGRDFTGYLKRMENALTVED